jgi:hypothetical protein
MENSGVVVVDAAGEAREESESDEADEVADDDGSGK